MSKYSPFKNYLEKLDNDEVLLGFSVIEDLIEEKLPESAYTRREWWGNEKNGRHVQAHSWMNAGWLVEDIDFERKEVRFVRVIDATPFLNDLYQSVDFDRELVNKFFIIFSLFEYALKKTGFLKHGNAAKPNWEDFAHSIEADFNLNKSPELKTAVNYMLSRPVQKQVKINQVLGFVPRERPSGKSDIQWLSLLIRGVRNNLFHGGKFRYERPRDTDLILHSLVILESWARLNPNVFTALEDIR